MILDEAAVRRIILDAGKIGPEFGLLVEVAAVTGARVSQLAQMEVQDLQADRTAPRLMMPSSKKGKGRKAVQRRPVPIRKRLPPSCGSLRRRARLRRRCCSSRAGRRGRNQTTPGDSLARQKLPAGPCRRHDATPCGIPASCARSSLECRFAWSRSTMTPRSRC